MSSRRETGADGPGAVRPILKWAGGKRQLLPELRRHYPGSFGRYVEPFVGSGAVFLDLHNLGLLDSRGVWLSDSNADVIGCYRMVRDAVADVIRHLRKLEDGHASAGADHYYAVRDGRFNAARAALGEAGLAERYTPELAAMLIYLNRTGYNGLFRVNARGNFNVPAGRYARVTICDADNLQRWSCALQRPDLTLEKCRFEQALERAGAGDFVYLDPPYAPLSQTAAFTSYTPGGFDLDQQRRLQRNVIGLARRGAAVLLSNSVSPVIGRLYRDAAAQSAGLRARTVAARRAINSHPGRRGAVREYVITNVRRGSVPAPASEPGARFQPGIETARPPADADGRTRRFV